MPLPVTVRPLRADETEAALALVRTVFAEYEAPDYTPEGIAEFEKSISDPAFLSRISWHGAFLQDELAGVIAARSEGKHIALFFVSGKYHRQGIGRALFSAVRRPGMTVNSSPFAVEIYRRLGFHETDSEQTVHGLRFTPMQLTPAIFNLHGYGGSPENAAFCALKENGFAAVSPAVDYGAQAPAELLARLLPEAEKADLLVGTSLGGFFAAVLAAKTGKPVLLVNPCLLPFYHLPLLGWQRDVREFIPLFAELERLQPEQVQCIVGDADETVTTHSFARALFGEARVQTVPGGKHSGHTLPLKAFFGAHLPF